MVVKKAEHRLKLLHPPGQSFTACAVQSLVGRAVKRVSLFVVDGRSSWSMSRRMAHHNLNKTNIAGLSFQHVLAPSSPWSSCIARKCSEPNNTGCPRFDR